MSELKPLKIIQKENAYKISQYVKHAELVELDEAPIPAWKKILKTLLFIGNPCYDNLTEQQKRLLHTIAPIWANIIQHRMDGKMIVTDDKGKRYDLNSMNARHCLVGEVNGFDETNCSNCYNYNIGFASLNSSSLRNSSILNIRNELGEFLDHYYVSHWNK